MKLWGELFAGPGVRQAAINFSWLVLERGMRLIFGLVVGVLVVRHLGPERLGALSYCLAIVALAGCLSALGLDAPVKRDVLQYPEMAESLLASAAFARWIIAALIYLALVGVAVLGWGVSGEERRLLAITALLLFQPAIWTPDLWMQARLRARVVVAVQLGALIAASLVRIVLIARGASVTLFAWAVVLEMVLGGAGIAWMAHRDGLSLKWKAIDFPVLRRLLAESWPLLFASLAIVVYMKIDEVMLRHLAGPEAVGTYAAAARLSEVWYFIPMALAASVLPGLIRARSAGAAEYRQRMQQYFDLSVALSYGLAVPVAYFAPWVVAVAYGQEFTDAGPILAVHIWSSVFVFLGVARGQWLVNESLPRFYLASTAAGAVLNIGLNFFLIPRWGGLGAAWATVFAYGLAAWVASYLHPAVRETAAMQTKALLIPFRACTYLRRR